MKLESMYLISSPMLYLALPCGLLVTLVQLQDSDAPGVFSMEPRKGGAGASGGRDQVVGLG